MHSTWTFYPFLCPWSTLVPSQPSFCRRSWRWPDKTSQHSAFETAGKLAVCIVGVGCSHTDSSTESLAPLGCWTSLSLCPPCLAGTLAQLCDWLSIRIVQTRVWNNGSYYITRNRLPLYNNKLASEFDIAPSGFDDSPLLFENRWLKSCLGSRRWGAKQDEI